MCYLVEFVSFLVFLLIFCMVNKLLTMIAIHYAIRTATNQRLSSPRLFSSVMRLGVDDPRMSKIVIHNKVVYLSGLTDTTASDGEPQYSAR